MSKLNIDAKEWKPSADAKEFKPSAAPVPRLNSTAQEWVPPQQQSAPMGMHMPYGVAQVPYGYVPFQPYMGDPYMYPNQMPFNNMQQQMPRMPYPQQGAPGHFMPQQQVPQQGQSQPGGESKTASTPAASGADAPAEQKDTPSASANPDPEISFGSVEPDVEAKSVASASQDAVAKDANSVPAGSDIAESQPAEEGSAGWSRGASLKQNTPPAELETSGGPGAAETAPAQADGNPSPWKRGSNMAEKTLAQMIMRNDGIIRFSKATLFSCNSSGKICPPELLDTYKHLASRERAPVTENRTPRSPTHKGRVGGRHNRRQEVEELHPDEKLIFAKEQSGETFRHNPNKQIEQSDGIMMQAKLILNQLSVENFDRLSEKFMNIGMETDELMCKVVDMIVSKAQLEEPFCFMYADLCRKITDKWTVVTDGAEAEDGAESTTSDLGKVFRTRLLMRCQEEFEQDRDAAVRAVMEMELADDDREEKLLILKKRYTGHMRFVGEIYMKDLIKANKMHMCVIELLQARDDEKLMCLCKLLQTIGKKLEDYENKKKRKSFKEYFATITELSQDKNLSSLVRFAFKDLIEMRANNWVARRQEEKAKKLSEFRQDDKSNNSSRGGNNTPRGGGMSQDARGNANAAPPAADEWTTVAGAGGRKNKGGGGAFRGGAAPDRGGRSGGAAMQSSTGGFGALSSGGKFSALNDASGIPRKTKKGTVAQLQTQLSAASSAASSPAAPSDTDSDGWQSASKAKSKPQRAADSPAASPVKPVPASADGASGSLSSHTVARVIAAMNEYFLNDLLDEAADVMRELVHPNAMGEALHSCITSVLEKKDSERAKFNVLMPGLHGRGVLSTEQAVRGLSRFLHDYDDIVIDVPRVGDYTADIIAHFFTKGVIPDLAFTLCLPDENNFSLSMGIYDLIVRTCAVVERLTTQNDAKRLFTASLTPSGGASLDKLDAMQRDQVDKAVEKHAAAYLI